MTERWCAHRYGEGVATGGMAASKNFRAYESLLKHRDERIRILSAQDSALVNALQRRATVVLQKSIREGFGLTVAAAMWKEAAVIGGNAGGIRYQSRDGENGFLVSSVAEAAQRIVQLLKDAELRKRLGQSARETVRQRFLMIRLLERSISICSTPSRRSTG
jgi:trehalose synthase